MTTDKKIIIAEFMGYFEPHKEAASRLEAEYDPKEDIAEVNSLSYDTSFDQLIPVWKKCKEVIEPAYLKAKKYAEWGNLVSSVEQSLVGDFNLTEAAETICDIIESYNSGVSPNEGEIINQDIIDFRYKLIDMSCDNNKSHEEKQILYKLLVLFNMHFRTRNYEIG